jgi:hypothetical protein
MKALLTELVTNARALVDIYMDLSGVARKVLNYVATSVCNHLFSSLVCSYKGTLVLPPSASYPPCSLLSAPLTPLSASQIKHTHGLAHFTVSQPLAPVVASLRQLHARWTTLEQAQRTFSASLSGELSKALEDAMDADGRSAFSSLSFTPPARTPPSHAVSRSQLPPHLPRPTTPTSSPPPPPSPPP